MSGSVDPTNHNTVQNNHKSKEALSETRYGKEPGLEPSETCVEEWEVPTDWMYTGHGEWTPPEEPTPITRGETPPKESEWIYKWRCSTDEDISLHQRVLEGGYPNR